MGYPGSGRRLNAEETKAMVEQGRAILEADRLAREAEAFDAHLEAGCACSAADADTNRRAIETLDRVIRAGFSAFVEPKFSGPPEVEVVEGHKHLVARHGFRAGGHTYTLILQQES